MKAKYNIQELGMLFEGKKYPFGEVYSRLNVINNNNKITKPELQAIIRKYKIISDKNPGDKWVVQIYLLGLTGWKTTRTEKEATDIAKNGLDFVKIYKKLSEDNKNKLFHSITNKKVKLEAKNSDIAKKGFFEKYFYRNETAVNILIDNI